MSIKVEYHGDEPFVILPQTIDLSNSNELKKVLLNLYEEGNETIVVDFRHLEVLDSSGLGKLLLFHKKLKDRGGELRVVKVLNENIRKMFNVIQFHKVIHIEGMSD